MWCALTYLLVARAVALSTELSSTNNMRVMRDTRHHSAEGPSKTGMGSFVKQPSDNDEMTPDSQDSHTDDEDHVGQQKDSISDDEKALKVLHHVAKNLPQHPSASIRQAKSNEVQSKPQTVNSGKINDVSGVLHPDDAPEIPRIIHHVYKIDLSNGPWPLTVQGNVWKTSYEAWLRFYPSPWYKHMFWDDSNAATFFLDHCPKQFSVYQSAREIVRADLIRYCLLKTLGGIYADLDYEPRKNFYNDLDSTKINLVQSPYKSETFQNSLMASRAGHQYWEEVLHQAMVRGPVQDDVLSISGPGLLESLNTTFNPNVIHPLPCNAFQRATHFMAHENRAAEEKHCMRLSVDAVTDARLKGIHWGTVSWMHGNSEYGRIYKAFHGIF